MVTKRWKLVDYINSDHEELYDLRNDPHELTNLMVGGLAVAEAPARVAAGPGPRPARTLHQLLRCEAAGCRL